MQGLIPRGTKEKSGWTIGLMTGTALDGAVDAALLRSDGERIFELGPWGLFPYPNAARRVLAEAIADARQWRFLGPEPGSFRSAEAVLTDIHVEAVTHLLDLAGMRAAEIDCAGFHGLTVLHEAPMPGARGRTRQLGDGADLARRIAMPVIHDFRSRDVAEGGQGAPLAPVYHAALLTFSGIAPPAAVLNLGGVANITCWDGAVESLIAFDTGPANGPINEWVERLGLGIMDRDGALARAGSVDEERLAHWLSHEFFASPFPKSLDRYDFNADLAAGLSPADGAASLTALSAAGVAHALALLPNRPHTLILCGGGRKNPALVAEIAARTGARVMQAEDAGWRGDAIEAEAFAFLAARALRQLPLSFPGTTGVGAPVSGGVLSLPAQEIPTHA